MIRNKNFDGSKPLLYLLATPIGNLEDISERAKKILNEADLVAAEDTRNTSKLLSLYGISKQTYSLREHNEKAASEFLIKTIKSGKKVVYVSDAGYPGISDPGSILVKECINNDIYVSVIPGCSAFISALVASGLDTEHFYFYGFLPAVSSHAKSELDTLKNKPETLIFYESPHRIGDTLKVMFETLGDRKICIARELTKLNEEYIRGSLSEIVSLDVETLKGEMVIVVEGKQITDEFDKDKINALIDLLRNKNLSNKDIVEIITSVYKIRKNVLFDMVNKKK